MAMKSPAAADQAGFSLVETLVALVLLAIGVAAVTTGFSQGHRVADEVRQRQRAIWLAQDKMAEKLARTYDTVTVPIRAAERVEGGVLIGADEAGGVVREWVIEADQPAPGLARVWVATRWTQRGAGYTYQIAGLLAEGLMR